MNRYAFYEKKTISVPEAIYWVLLIENDKYIDKYSFWYNAFGLRVSYKKVYNGDTLNVTKSYDGVFMKTVLESGECEYVSRKPNVVLFNGKLLNGKVKLPSNGIIKQWFLANDMYDR